MLTVVGNTMQDKELQKPTPSEIIREHQRLKRSTPTSSFSLCREGKDAWIRLQGGAWVTGEGPLYAALRATGEMCYSLGFFKSSFEAISLRNLTQGDYQKNLKLADPSSMSLLCHTIKPEGEGVAIVTSCSLSGWTCFAQCTRLGREKQLLPSQLF